jgi:hypothetical protein
MGEKREGSWGTRRRAHLGGEETAGWPLAVCSGGRRWSPAVVVLRCGSGRGKGQRMHSSTPWNSWWCWLESQRQRQNVGGGGELGNGRWRRDSMQVWRRSGAVLHRQGGGLGRGARVKIGCRLVVLGTDVQAWGRRTPAESRRRPAPLRLGPDGPRTGQRLGWGRGSDGLEGA